MNCQTQPCCSGQEVWIMTNTLPRDFVGLATIMSITSLLLSGTCTCWWHGLGRYPVWAQITQISSIFNHCAASSPPTHLCCTSPPTEVQSSSGQVTKMSNACQQEKSLLCVCRKCHLKSVKKKAPMCSVMTIEPSRYSYSMKHCFFFFLVV